MKKKRKLRFTALFISLLIVVGLMGWALVFYSSITGKAALQWEYPVLGTKFQESTIAPPKIIPSVPEFSPPEPISECDEAKLIRKFVCDVYGEKYPDGCGFWSGRCKGVRELCELSQEEVEVKCEIFSDNK